MTIKNCIFAIKTCFRFGKAVALLKILHTLSSLLLTFLPLILTKEILNMLSSQQSISSIVQESVMFFGFICLNKILKLLLESYSEILLTQFEKRYKQEFCALAMSIEYAKLENCEIQNMIELAGQGENLTFYIDKLFSLLEDVAKIISCISILFTVNIIVAVISILPCLIKMVMKYFLVRANTKFFSILSLLWRKENYLERFAKDVSGAKEIRINNLQSWIINRYNAIIKKYMQEDLRIRRLCFLNNCLNHLIFAIQMFIVYIVGARQVIANILQIGDFTLYLSSVLLFSNALDQLVIDLSDVYEKNIFVTPLRDLFSLKITAASPTQSDVSTKIKDDFVLKFDDVCFQYPNSDVLILKNINFEIRGDEKLIIVGENGAGKTTLVKLLCRLYQPTSGRILLNGMDINKIPYEVYQNFIGSVFQDFKLICATLIENIVCDQTLDYDKLSFVLEKSGFSDRFTHLANGYETIIYKYFNEEGIEFSGGEMQKIAIARLLYKDAKLYVLDEPTAALDPIAESEVFKNLKHVSDSRGCLFISHRMSSVKFCQRIIVLEKGIITEYGAFDDLIKLKGKFAELYGAQAEYYR